MEFLQTVSVQAANDAEIARKVRAIKRIAEEPEEVEEVEETVVDRPEPVGGVAYDPGPSYFVVGMGAAAPGKVAHVELMGQVGVPIQGLGARFGCDPALELVSSHVDEGLLEQLGLKSINSIIDQNRGGGVEGFITVMLLFMGPILIDVDATAEEAAAEKARILALGRGPRETGLSPFTVLAHLGFRVPENAAPGHRYHLDNTSMKYGRRLSDGKGGSRMIRLATDFGTSKDVSRWGIRPELQSGWVDVL